MLWYGHDQNEQLQPSLSFLFRRNSELDIEMMLLWNFGIIRQLLQELANATWKRDWCHSGEAVASRKLSSLQGFIVLIDFQGCQGLLRQFHTPAIGCDKCGNL